MKYIVKFVPQPDACTRCKRAAYVNGVDDTEGYNYHIVEELSDSPVHPPTCRCKMVVVSELKTEKSAENISQSDENSKKEAVVAQERSYEEVNKRMRDVEDVVKGSTIKKPWETFATIVSDGVKKLIGFFDNLFGRRK